MTRQVSRAVARRYLVLRHLLAPPRSLPPDPESVMRVFDRLGSLQFDPIDVAGRNHDLSLLARISGYRREWTDALLYDERRLYETYNKGLDLVPTAELPWFRLTWDRSRVRHESTTFQEHADLVQELLERIREQGPLSPTDMPARPAIEWLWRPTNQVRAVLEALAFAGVLALARREGNRRVYDLAERLFPADLLGRSVAPDEQHEHRVLARYRAHGLLAVDSSQEAWVPMYVHERRPVIARLEETGRLVPVAVEGLKTVRHLPATDLLYLEQAESEIAGGAPPGAVEAAVAFIAPLDPIVWDRRLLRDLWGFDYIWEVYVPEPKRRWGYYVLPLLYGDAFAGRVELRADRKAGVLEVLGIWPEPDAEQPPRSAVDAALDAHRAFVGAKKIRWAAARAARGGPRRSASRSSPPRR